MTDKEFNDKLAYEIFTKPAKEKKEKEERIINFMQTWGKVVEEKRAYGIIR